MWFHMKYRAFDLLKLHFLNKEKRVQNINRWKKNDIESYFIIIPVIKLYILWCIKKKHIRWYMYHAKSTVTIEIVRELFWHVTLLWHSGKTKTKKKLKKYWFIRDIITSSLKKDIWLTGFIGGKCVMCKCIIRSRRVQGSDGKPYRVK